MKIEDFNLELTLDSGQVFGFTKSEDKVYSGAISGAFVELSQGVGATPACPVGRRRVAPTFPLPSQIAKSHERTLRQLGLGYRAPFLQKTAQFISVNPHALQVIKDSSYEEAKARVLLFPGIGPKVADCVLLYGFRKFEAFPVDVWILRVVRKLYFNNRKVSEDKIHSFGQKRWGKDAGYVQQYLFHGARTGILV